jgi:ADP-ribose pyrophosphatase YjhB (NUDIX family)
MRKRRNSAPRRGVCIIPIRDDGKILLQFRCKCAWIYPLYWAFFGGGVKYGESPNEALIREILKELGFAISDHMLFNVAWHRKPGGVRVLDHTYVVEWRWSDQRIRLGEGKDWGWFTVEEALALEKLPPHERSDLLLLKQKRPELTGMALAA